MHTIVNEHLKTPLPIAAIAATLVEHPGQRLQCLPNIAGDRHMGEYHCPARLGTGFDLGYRTNKPKKFR